MLFDRDFVPFEPPRRPARLHRGKLRDHRGGGDLGRNGARLPLSAVSAQKPKPVARVTLPPAGGMPLLIIPREPPAATLSFSKTRNAS